MRRILLSCVAAVACVVTFTGRVIAADDWLPIDPAELTMTSEPKAPGAPAIYLYRQVDRDDQTHKQVYYTRVKILTEEGRKNADVELVFIKGIDRINNIKARTIRPDGTVVNFDGKVYEKTIVKARGVKYLAKTFALPDVQVGGIIEYRCEKSWAEDLLYNSRWILSADLFTKHAKFSLQQNARFGLRWVWQGLPDGTPPPSRDGHTVRLEVRDIPAFQEEDFMPPPDELKAHVNFVYQSYNLENEPEKFWKKEGTINYEHVEAFVNKRKQMEQAVAGVVTPTDAPEVKLQKIYARVQQVRNTSSEEEKSEKELKREKQKANNNVEDVWKNQYGTGGDITWLFLGLVRAAGFEAYPVLVSRRNVYFFNANLMNPSQLDDSVVLVKSGGKELYFDPGTAFTPYGYLPWSETWVTGLKLDKEGGSWVKTSIPGSADSVVNRVAELRMTDTGGVEGKLTVTYTGLEAQRRRLEELNEDDVDKKKFLEEEVKQWVPVGIDVELSNKPNWKSSAVTLVAEFDFKAEGWASPAGRRILIPVGFFTAQEKHLFEHANRVHPVYFEYPFETKDEVNITLPLNWNVKSLPPAQTHDGKMIVYTLDVEDKQGVEHIARVLKVDMLGLEVKYYGALRTFFQHIQTADEQQIVAQPGS
jgi:hypothetical protein